ncbi:unnamed protein product [Tuber melanosporum]|uniref:(Perigord truffle) hypothetical protein n=1 Tax=Tuber melanosporum (strain Mel28) TaxID=656061 RepID=D5GC32_TUBMM|nr:uncharacterized protein GSTUM_00000543001 [Tuber melanosporum]CAZ82075.1 unnamed protein product [Tuber melanosporum]
MLLKDTIKTIVRDEVIGVTALAKEPAATGAYLYPLRGIAYFLTHRAIWKPLTSRLLPLLTLSTGVITSMFLFTYIPQSFLLTFVNGPVAWISTIALVLSESAVIITALSRAFLIDEALVDIFDGVLLLEGMSVLVKNGRKLEAGNGVMGKLGALVKKPLEKLTVKSLVSYLIWLPVNFIPIVGTVVFIFVQGRKLGPTYHARYFQLKSYSNQQKNAFVERNMPAYIGFGTASMLLQLTPIVSILFSYTNTVGAALWAVDIERGNRPAEGKRVGGIVAGGEKEL